MVLHIVKVWEEKSISLLLQSYTYRSQAMEKEPYFARKVLIRKKKIIFKNNPPKGILISAMLPNIGKQH